VTTHDFLSMYDAKVAEYLLAVAYLLLFVPMWRFVQSPAGAEARVGAAAAHEVARPSARTSLGWFTAPDDVAVHPGHAWARLGADGLVTVGIDDFAQKLVGPEAVILPKAGDRVLQGQPAFAVGDRVVTVPMLSPVDGEVVAVNTGAAERPDALKDPYGAGWLFKVKAPAEATQRAPLMLGERAREYLERAAEALSLRMSPELGHVMQDGGVPIQGIARALAGGGWAGMARHFLLTDGSES
jgi:glycine cleavage system H lipoate-binding protein